MSLKDRAKLRAAIMEDIAEQFLSEMRNSREVKLPLDNAIAFIKERELRTKKKSK